MADLRQVRHLASALQASIEGRTEETSALLTKAVADSGMWISGDQRIGESDLATLLGMTSGTLANRRRQGSGPPAFNLAGNGHRITYRISDVAAWIEASRNS